MVAGLVVKYELEHGGRRLDSVAIRMWMLEKETTADAVIMLRFGIIWRE